MVLYTRGGDDGTTGLPSADDKTSPRVRKDDVRVAALGAVDELNAHLGSCLAEANRITHVMIRDALVDAQRELLTIGATLAALGAGVAPPVQLPQAKVSKMESDIDAICADLPELKHFILPGGSELAARLHVARAVARRAERQIQTMLAELPKTAPGRSDAAVVTLMAYINRLSDFLFALARLANRDSGESDVLWIP